MGNTQLVGILNVTPDSFSDGGLHNTPEKALLQAQNMVQKGATVLDIGAESTRPGAISLTWQEEWARLEPILKILKNAKLNTLLSIDTRHPETAQNALEIGADWINDVSGFGEKAMINVIKNSNAQLVVMHSISIPADPNITLPDNADPVEEIYSWAEYRMKMLGAAGITRERIIFDPGIGFGKTAEQSLALLAGVDRLKNLGVPLLIGHSRKSFLKLFTDKNADGRDAETCVVTAWLAQHGVDYLRVHNVSANHQAIRIMETLDGHH